MKKIICILSVIFLWMETFCQEGYYSIELDYTGLLARGLTDEIYISSDRVWNLEFNSDSVIFEGIGYKIKDEDTLLCQYLSDLEYVMRNNTFKYTCHWMDSNFGIEGICLDGTSLVGLICFGQEAEVFNITGCYYEYNPMHRDMYQSFFNIVYYLLCETPVAKELEYITLWQLLVFEKELNKDQTQLVKYPKMGKIRIPGEAKLLDLSDRSPGREIPRIRPIKSISDFN